MMRNFIGSAIYQIIIILALDGKTLRELSDDELDDLLKTLCCVSRCQPKDKYRVVQRL